MKPSHFILQRKTVNLCRSNSRKLLQAAKAPPPPALRKNKQTSSQTRFCRICSVLQPKLQRLHRVWVQCSAGGCRLSARRSFRLIKNILVRCLHSVAPVLSSWHLPPCLFISNERVWTSHDWTNHMDRWYRMNEGGLWESSRFGQTLTNMTWHELCTAVAPLQMDISLIGWKKMLMQRAPCAHSQIVKTVMGTNRWQMPDGDFFFFPILLFFATGCFLTFGGAVSPAPPAPLLVKLTELECSCFIFNVCCGVFISRFVVFSVWAFMLMFFNIKKY